MQRKKITPRKNVLNTLTEVEFLCMYTLHRGLPSLCTMTKGPKVKTSASAGGDEEGITMKQLAF